MEINNFFNLFIRLDLVNYRKHELRQINKFFNLFTRRGLVNLRQQENQENK